MIILRRTTFLSTLLLILTFVAPISYNNSSAKAAPQRVSREEYINRYKSIAIDHQRRYGIPASITMAQGILESDCGNSTLARGSNNHFGIKCKDYWKGKTYTHTDDAPDECFRAYDSVEASYEDHAEFLDNSPRYDSLFRFKPDDYKSWARGLKAAGYATAPDYAPRLISLIESNNLHLLDEEALNGSSRQKKAKVELTLNGAGIDPNNYEVSLSTDSGYTLYRTNKSVYIKAKSGDTYASLAKTFSLSAGALRGYNDQNSRKATITVGEKIYIEAKKRKWTGKEREYRVTGGETLRSIGQKYGIREKSLRQINDIKKKYDVSSGQKIRLK